MATPRDYYYYGSIFKTTVQVLDVFNDFKVKRFKPDGTVGSELNVPVKYYPKKQMLYDMGDPDIRYSQRMPIMTVEKFGNMTYRKADEVAPLDDRLYNFDNLEPASAAEFYFKQPIPVNIKYRLTMWSTLESDLDQLIENIVFWFRPFVVVRFRAPHLPESSPESLLDIKLQWDGSVTLNNETGNDKKLIYTATLDFDAYTYIFGDRSSSHIIHKVFNNLYTCPPDSFNPYTGEFSTETIVTFVTGGTGSPADYSTLTTFVTGGPITGGGWSPPSGWDAWVGKPWLPKET